MTTKRTGPSPAKAKEMLKDGSVQGHSLTDKQKKFFQAVAHGWRPPKRRK